MMKQYLNTALLVLITSVSLWGRDFSSFGRNITIYVASVQFPDSVKLLPDMRAYFEGYKISCEKDRDLNRILFSIPTDRSTRKLYLLVAEQSLFEAEENTIKYLKVRPQDSYKLWSLELVHKKQLDEVESKITGGIKLNADEKSKYAWIIKEEVVPHDTGQLPDNTVILLFDPKLIDRLEGGSGVELPKMMITPDVLKQVGSEKALHDISAQYLLSALDCDAFHARIQSDVKQDPHTNRVTITTS